MQKQDTRIHIQVLHSVKNYSIYIYIIYFPVFCMQYRCRSKRGVVEHLRICDLTVNVGTTILHWHATLARPWVVALIRLTHQATCRLSPFWVNNPRPESHCRTSERQRPRPIFAHSSAISRHLEKSGIQHVSREIHAISQIHCSSLHVLQLNSGISWNLTQIRLCAKRQKLESQPLARSCFWVTPRG